MRRTVLVVGLIGFLLGGYYLVGAGSLEPPGPPAPTMVTLDQIDQKLNTLIGPAARFIGVTVAKTTGNAGWKGMANLCQTEFGAAHPSARMCTSAEIFSTAPAAWPLIPEGDPAIGYATAWLHPVYQASGPLVMDVSGVSLASSPSQEGNLSCSGWYSAASNTYGLVLADGGNVHGATRAAYCSYLLSVACCATE